MIQPVSRSIAAPMLLNPLIGNAGLESDLWHRWRIHDPGATARIDDGSWDRVFGIYLRAEEDGINRFADHAYDWRLNLRFAASLP